MKEILLQYATYNLWANNLLLEVINNLPEEEQKQTITSSFDTLYQTVLHLLDAESIWWQRMKLQERIVRPSESASSSLKEVGNGLLQQDAQWQQWVANAQEHMLLHEFIYYNSKKEKFKQPVYQMLLHLFNHGTYHRGQLVTMLRQLGVEKIPQTDFIVWSRKRSF